jgi:hypothetical protein
MQMPRLPAGWLEWERVDGQQFAGFRQWSHMIATDEVQAIGKQCYSRNIVIIPFSYSSVAEVTWCHSPTIVAVLKSVPLDPVRSSATSTDLLVATPHKVRQIARNTMIIHRARGWIAPRAAWPPGSGKPGLERRLGHG